MGRTPTGRDLAYRLGDRWRGLRRVRHLAVGMRQLLRDLGFALAVVVLMGTAAFAALIYFEIWRVS